MLFRSIILDRGLQDVREVLDREVEGDFAVEIVDEADGLQRLGIVAQGDHGAD